MFSLRQVNPFSQSWSRHREYFTHILFLQIFMHAHRNQVTHKHEQKFMQGVRNYFKTL